MRGVTDADNQLSELLLNFTENLWYFFVRFVVRREHANFPEAPGQRPPLCQDPTPTAQDLRTVPAIHSPEPPYVPRISRAQAPCQPADASRFWLPHIFTRSPKGPVRFARTFS